MAKYCKAFGEDPVDLLVAAFLEAKGIDPKDITGYRLSRGFDQFGMISIDMPFASVPESARPEQEG